VGKRVYREVDMLVVSSTVSLISNYFLQFFEAFIDKARFQVQLFTYLNLSYALCTRQVHESVFFFALFSTIFELSPDIN
jgi:hypothetical protein